MPIDKEAFRSAINGICVAIFPLTENERKKWQVHTVKQVVLFVGRLKIPQQNE